MSADPKVARSDLVAGFRRRLQEGQQALRERYLETRDASTMLAGRATLIDTLLHGIWEAHAFPGDTALVAVGGYGRGELYPASDVDLLILLGSPPDEAMTAKLEAMIGVFWDVGLEIGHSVRTVEDCLSEAAGDITVQTALLETRRLCGSSALFKRFQQGLMAALDPQAFYRAKKLEQEERYRRYQETPYSLEPNTKESPGGLRDLQVILWIARAAGFGKTWAELEQRSFVTAEERGHLERCERNLQHLRIRLHYHLKRREDRLMFDYQTALAEQFGVEGKGPRRPSEVLMQDYYRNAKSVTQLNVILLQTMGAAIFPPPEQPPQPINARFQAAHGLLDITHDDTFAQHPSAILECFLLLQQHAELGGMTARALRGLYRARTAIDDDFRANPKHRAMFLSMFQQPRGLVHELRRMNQYGVLGRYLPNFGAIVGQMQHDLFHVYTVDQHILMVVRNVRRFTMPEFSHEAPFCTRLIAEFDRHWLIYIAALFHDIAKGRGGDHSEQGTGDAQAFCDAHGITGEDAELVVWLVRQHLTMSQVAQKQDVSDPEVVAAFAAVVGNVRKLTALYLLTVADIRGTSPKVWNNWKAQLLEQLFSATRKLLESGKAPEVHGVIVERQAEAMRLLRYFALSTTVHERLWKQLDTVYFLRHSAEEIAWHTRCLHYRPITDKPVVKARINPNGEGLQVMVYTHDQPDLFVRIVGFFGRAGYSIVDAKIHTTRHGYALDSFMLLDVSDRDNDREMIAFIEHELATRIETEAPIDSPTSARLSRQVKHFPIEPQVRIEPDDKGAAYVLSLVAADRPGLLYSVAATLTRHGAGLQTAKVATLGERAEDTFLISGGDLGQAGGRIALESELLELLRV